MGTLNFYFKILVPKINQLYLKTDKHAALKLQRRQIEVKIYERYTVKN